MARTYLCDQCKTKPADPKGPEEPGFSGNFEELGKPQDVYTTPGKENQSIVDVTTPKAPTEVKRPTIEDLKRLKRERDQAIENIASKAV